MFVEEIWRYPVKSMAGERMPRAEVGELGIAGDRTILVHVGGRVAIASGFLKSAQKLRALDANSAPAPGTPNFNTALIESLNSVERPQLRRVRQGCIIQVCLNRKPAGARMRYSGETQRKSRLRYGHP
jgi:hypothetical protein